MVKELKYCWYVEDLEVNENVKFKVKDYVKKYMGKFGSVYSKIGLLDIWSFYWLDWWIRIK